MVSFILPCQWLFVLEMFNLNGPWLCLPPVKSLHGAFRTEDSRTLSDYKLTFLQIVCSHEHYVALNLPLQRITKSRANGMFLLYQVMENYV